MNVIGKGESTAVEDGIGRKIEGHSACYRNAMKTSTSAIGTQCVA